MVRPDLDILPRPIVQHLDQSGRDPHAALRFEDQALLIAATIHLAEGEIRFLVHTIGGWVPQDVGFPVAGYHIQLVGGDAESRGNARPGCADYPIGPVKGIQYR